MARLTVLFKAQMSKAFGLFYFPSRIKCGINSSGVLYFTIFVLILILSLALNDQQQDYNVTPSGL